MTYELFECSEACDAIIKTRCDDRGLRISSTSAVKRYWVEFLSLKFWTLTVPSSEFLRWRLEQKPDGWFLCMVGSGLNVFNVQTVVRIIERQKGIRWMPWHQEATKDVARCEKLWGAASKL